jgi:osmotically-inducible protein OsmY
MEDREITMVTDKGLGKLIKQAFMRDERLSFQPIEVTIKEGIVILTGSVQTYRRKLAAHEVVSSFEDCRGVVNKLTVKPTGSLSDREITNNVRAPLDSHADITKETIAVSVTKGVVSLNGNVGSQWERIVAEDVARSARGVKDVNNFLVVSLPDKMEDKRLEQDVEDALSHASGLKDKKINVSVSGGVIVLSGYVPSLIQKEMTERVAHQFHLWEIRNEIVFTGQ